MYDHLVKLKEMLKEPLYDSEYFKKNNIVHYDLPFRDGTTPTQEIVDESCKIFSSIRASNQNIAVHCKAGFGRTGTIIGVWLALYYGISPKDGICWQRVSRPGMVNGVQAKY